jgi:hypothetical protein
MDKLGTHATIGSMHFLGGEEFWLSFEPTAGRALKPKNYAPDLEFHVC